MRFAIAFLFLSLVSVVSVSSKDTISTAQLSTHVIHEEALSGSDQCSATAIAPHAILTASHCEMPTDEVYIDDEEDAATIYKVIRDGNDHTIYLVSDTFQNTAEFSGRSARIGEEVFMFGNPAEYSKLYRRGYVAGFKYPDAIAHLFGAPGIVETLYDLNVFEGDSGSAIFNKDGKILGVLSAVEINTAEDAKQFSIKLAGSFDLNFTADQMKEVMDFNPPVQKSN